MRKQSIIPVLVLLAALATAHAASAATDCIGCHGKETPGAVADWKLSKHAANDIGCEACHGSAHTGAADVANVTMPTPATCNECHETQVAQFNKGKHALGWLRTRRCPPRTSCRWRCATA